MKNKIIIVLILALQICGAITFATINAKYLYGTSDDLFYFWRYGAFSLFGIIGGVVCYFIPLEKADRFYNKAVKRTIIAIASLAALLFILNLFFYFNDGLTLKDSVNAWLNPAAYANSNGYLILKNLQIREAAQLFGGQDIGFNGLFVNEMVLSYIIGTLGWVFFGIVLLSATFLSYTMLARSLKIQIPICRLIAVSIWVYITFSFIWNVCTVFNLVPFASCHFPFLSYDRFSLVFDLCLMGIFIRMLEPLQIR